MPRKIATVIQFLEVPNNETGVFDAVNRVDMTLKSSGNLRDA